jgi:hypothetical protein
MTDHSDIARHLLDEGWLLTDRGWVSPWAHGAGDITYRQADAALRAHDAWTRYMIDCATTGSGYVGVG